MKKLVIMTGASGSGKTSILNDVKERFTSAGLFASCLHFDSIGIPSEKEMIASKGSCEAWQRGATLEWIENLAKSSTDESIVVFEGQMRIAFIKEALLKFNLSFAHIILIDCDDSTRIKRLEKRGQVELASQEMLNWASYLRKEAKTEGLYTLDTSSLSIQESADQLMEASGLTSLLKKSPDTVEICPYDKAWPSIFESESAKIKVALGKRLLSIHHFGSTAVPNLSAKPIIDILCVVKEIKSIDISALQEHGFTPRGEVIPTGRYFKKKCPAIHLHLFQEGNPLIAKNIQFRDWLRENAAGRTAYSNLKKELASKYSRQNGMAYCRAKTAFIESTLEKTGNE